MEKPAQPSPYLFSLALVLKSSITFRNRVTVKRPPSLSSAINLVERSVLTGLIGRPHVGAGLEEACPLPRRVGHRRGEPLSPSAWWPTRRGPGRESRGRGNQGVPYHFLLALPAISASCPAAPAPGQGLEACLGSAAALGEAGDQLCRHPGSGFCSRNACETELLWGLSSHEGRAAPGSDAVWLWQSGVAFRFVQTIPQCPFHIQRPNVLIRHSLPACLNTRPLWSLVPKDMGVVGARGLRVFESCRPDNRSPWAQAGPRAC